MVILQRYGFIVRVLMDFGRDGCTNTVWIEIFFSAYGFLTEVRLWVHSLEIGLRSGTLRIQDSYFPQRSFMKKIGLFAFALLFTSALAQTSIAPKAADLLDKAKVAHGGDALESMTSYRDIGTYTVYQNGVVAGELEAIQILDFDGERVRVELKAGGAVVQILQATKDEAWTWTQAAGVVNMPKADAKSIFDGLNQGLFGLRAGSQNRDSAKLEGVVNLGNGLSGESLTVFTNGAEANYVFDKSGLWIGGKTTSEGQEVMTVLGDYKVQDGVKVPFSSKTTTAGKPFIDIALSSVQINPDLSDDDFAQPQ
jgi:hypothetical protein